jgi:hypothetical protein
MEASRTPLPKKMLSMQNLEEVQQLGCKLERGQRQIARRGRLDRPGHGLCVLETRRGSEGRLAATEKLERPPTESRSIRRNLAERRRNPPAPARCFVTSWRAPTASSPDAEVLAMT